MPENSYENTDSVAQKDVLLSTWEHTHCPVAFAHLPPLTQDTVCLKDTLYGTRRCVNTHRTQVNLEVAPRALEATGTRALAIAHASVAARQRGAAVTLKREQR